MSKCKKVEYASNRLASTNAQRVNTYNNKHGIAGKMRSYKCQKCNKYHLTHLTKSEYKVNVLNSKGKGKTS